MVLLLSVERRKGKAWRNHHFVSIYNMRWTNIHMVSRFISARKQVSVPKLKELLLSGRTIKKENTDLISSKHFQNPSYTHNPLCPSTTSHSELKLYVFPHSMRCRAILAEVPMSPTTERLGLKKSPPERKPICVLIHSAGLDMSKQPAFTAVATLFTSNCQAAGISTHSLNQGW